MTALPRNETKQGESEVNKTCLYEKAGPAENPRHHSQNPEDLGFRGCDRNIIPERQGTVINVYIRNMKRIILFSLVIPLFASCTSDPKTAEEKLAEMLKDRPTMNVETGDSLFCRAAKTLARYDWDCAEPDRENKSCISYSNGSIMIKTGMSFEESWTCFFFESFNMLNAKEFGDLYEKGIKGEFSRTEWVEQNTLLEYKAAKKFLQFAKGFLLPYLEEKGIEAPTLIRFMKMYEEPFSQWMKADQDEYPWNYWGWYYDTYLTKK